jgi:hypothetical protein
MEEENNNEIRDDQFVFNEIWRVWNSVPKYYCVHANALWLNEEMEKLNVHCQFRELETVLLEQQFEDCKSDEKENDDQTEKISPINNDCKSPEVTLIWKPEIEFQKLANIIWNPSEIHEFVSRNLIIDKSIEEILSIRHKIDQLHKKFMQSQSSEDSFRRRNRVIPAKKKESNFFYSASKRNNRKRHSAKLSTSLNHLLKLLCYPESFFSSNHDSKNQVMILKEAFDKISFLRTKYEALLKQFRSNSCNFSLL